MIMRSSSDTKEEACEQPYEGAKGVPAVGAADLCNSFIAERHICADGEWRARYVSFRHAPAHRGDELFHSRLGDLHGATG